MSESMIALSGGGGGFNSPAAASGGGGSTTGSSSRMLPDVTSTSTTHQHMRPHHRHHHHGSGYDWYCEENASKWRGMFAGNPLKQGPNESPLEKVLAKTVLQIQANSGGGGGSCHGPSSGGCNQLTAEQETLEYVENLLLKLLAMLTAKPSPVSKADVEVRRLSSILLVIRNTYRILEVLGYFLI